MSQTYPNYWFEWQQAAKKANFDFDLLNNLFDARAIRFYELAKLWRAISDRAETESFTNKNSNKTSKNLYNRTEISYEKFAALIPIPYLRSENEIEYQIKDLNRRTFHCAESHCPAPFVIPQ